MPFLLLNLPLDLRNRVISHMHPADLFSLYLTSTKMGRIVKSLKIRAENFEWSFCMVRHALSGDHPQVELKFADDRIFILALSMDTDWPFKWTTIDGMKVFVSGPFHRTKKAAWFMLPLHPDLFSMNVSLLETATRPLLDCFDPKAFSVRSRGLNISMTPFFLKYTKTFKKFSATSLGLLARREPFGETQMKLLLHDIDVEELEVEGVVDVLNFNGVLNHRRLSTIGGWLTLDNVLNMQCSVLEVAESNFPASDLNKIIKTWCEGGKRLARLEKMEISCEKRFETDTLFAGIETKRDSEEHGVWIRRADGKVASVTTNGKQLRLVVSK